VVKIYRVIRIKLNQLV